MSDHIYPGEIRITLALPHDGNLVVSAGHAGTDGGGRGSYQIRHFFLADVERTPNRVACSVEATAQHD